MGGMKCTYAAIMFLLILASFNKAQIPLPRSEPDEFKKSDSASKSESKQTNQENEFHTIKKQIRALSESRDLEGLMALGTEVAAKWEQKETGFYPYLMAEICGNIASQDFNNKDQFVRIKECALLGLRKSEKMHIEHQLRLVALLSNTEEYSRGLTPVSKWDTDRTVRAKHWCDTWNRLHGEIDDSFDFKENRPIYHPRMTADEKAEAAKYTRQKMVRKIRETYSKQFRSFFVEAYSMPPFNMVELESMLNSCSIPPEQKASIVEAVMMKSE
jgi:hypothetical protein